LYSHHHAKKQTTACPTIAAAWLKSTSSCCAITSTQMMPRATTCTPSEFCDPVLIYNAPPNYVFKVDISVSHPSTSGNGVDMEFKVDNNVFYTATLFTSSFSNSFIGTFNSISLSINSRSDCSSVRCFSSCAFDIFILHFTIIFVIHDRMLPTTALL